MKNAQPERRPVVKTMKAGIKNWILTDNTFFRVSWKLRRFNRSRRWSAHSTYVGNVIVSEVSIVFPFVLVSGRSACEDVRRVLTRYVISEIIR